MTEDTFRILYDQESGLKYVSKVVDELTKNHGRMIKEMGVMGTCRKCQVIPCVLCYHFRKTESEMRSFMAKSQS